MATVRHASDAVPASDRRAGGHRARRAVRRGPTAAGVPAIPSASVPAPIPDRSAGRRGDRPADRPDDRYGSDVLVSRRPPAAPRPVPAEPGLVVEDPLSGFCGAVVACTGTEVTLEDRQGRRRLFPMTAGAFLLDGRPVTLERPSRAAAVARSASGSRAVTGLRARTAMASRIWVEGIHDAALIERVWGHDLRAEGVVVEPLDGLDHLVAAVDGFRPSERRRLGVLVDHWVPGSKETRIGADVTRRHPAGLLVDGHPYVDVWQAVRPSAVGIAAWPDVPRGVDWKAGVCAALGVADPAAMWGRVNGAVRDYRDLETPIIGAMERLIDFVTAGDPGDS